MTNYGGSNSTHIIYSSFDSLIIYQIKLLLFIIFKHIELRNLTLKQIDITQASLLFPKNIFFPIYYFEDKMWHKTIFSSCSNLGVYSLWKMVLWYEVNFVRILNNIFHPGFNFKHNFFLYFIWTREFNV